jgi:hypothetical protein
MASFDWGSHFHPDVKFVNRSILFSLVRQVIIDHQSMIGDPAGGSVNLRALHNPEPQPNK